MDFLQKGRTYGPIWKQWKSFKLTTIITQTPVTTNIRLIFYLQGVRYKTPKRPQVFLYVKHTLFYFVNFTDKMSNGITCILGVLSTDNIIVTRIKGLVRSLRNILWQMDNIISTYQVIYVRRSRIICLSLICSTGRFTNGVFFLLLYFTWYV